MDKSLAFNRVNKIKLVAIDVGNTFIHLSVYYSGKSRQKYRVNTQLQNKDLKLKMAEVLHKIGKADKVIICSVVPKVNALLEAQVKVCLNLSAQVIGRDILVPVKNKYKKPSQVGQDRLVCAYAACVLYGEPVIIIDLGTAITVDAVNERREYLGGIIVPGIQMTSRTLFEHTALLPLVKIAKPRALIGRDTKGSILSGIFWGYSAMLKGLVALLAKEFKGTPKVVMTGGHAKLMSRYIKEVVHSTDSDLVMKGIAILGNAL